MKAALVKAPLVLKIIESQNGFWLEETFQILKV